MYGEASGDYIYFKHQFSCNIHLFPGYVIRVLCFLKCVGGYFFSSPALPQKAITYHLNQWGRTMKIFYFFIIIYHILTFTCISGIYSPVFSGQSLRIGTDEWPPYEYSDGDRITGYCTEIVEHIFNKTGMKIEDIKIYPWKRAIIYLSQNKLDAVYTAGKSQDWVQEFHYPEEPMFHRY